MVKIYELNVPVNPHLWGNLLLPIYGEIPPYKWGEN